jgi:ABC-2 type transport system ATP-binding protein
MEQAEQICDQICIIARGGKVLDGNLAEIKRAAAEEGRIALAFTDDAARGRALDGVLADPALVLAHRDVTDGLEVQLAPAATSERLLAALVEAKLAVRRFEVVTPTLHQIFVDRVGDAAKVATREEA